MMDPASVHGNRYASSCGGEDHFNRRRLLQAAGLSGLAWLTPLAESLSRAAEVVPRGAPAKSVILVWLAGGPSQLETFDPHPDTNIAAGSRAIKTSVVGVNIAAGFEQLADQMHDVAIVRSVVSKEGDHERATYNVKTGYRPDPTVVHPSIGAVACHQLPIGTAEIPRHISIMPNRWPGRGGYLGNQYDAFKTHNVSGHVPDIATRVSKERFERRLDDLDVVERSFARGRLKQIEEHRTQHRTTIDRAVRMMPSEQLEAFNVMTAPEEQRLAFGDTPFGRGMLAALRLIEVGVRCVEVTLDGWDTHINNHESHAELLSVLDPALAALIQQLRERKLLDQTVVICGGEFGRTPQVNDVNGRDHWPHGFSIALAGGGIRGGRVIGATDPEGSMQVDRPLEVADIHATVLHALGIHYQKFLDTPVGRPLRLSEGTVIDELLS